MLHTLWRSVCCQDELRITCIVKVHPHALLLSPFDYPDWMDIRRADGNKLFQSEFISIIYPGADLIQQLEFNLLNSSVALFGYYFAAFTIDLPWMGRRRMQAPPLSL